MKEKYGTIRASIVVAQGREKLFLQDRRKSVIAAD